MKQQFLTDEDYGVVTPVAGEDIFYKTVENVVADMPVIPISEPDIIDVPPPPSISIPEWYNPVKPVADVLPTEFAIDNSPVMNVDIPYGGNVIPHVVTDVEAGVYDYNLLSRLSSKLKAANISGRSARLDDEELEYFAKLDNAGFASTVIGAAWWADIYSTITPPVTPPPVDVGEPVLDLSYNVLSSPTNPNPVVIAQVAVLEATTPEEIAEAGVVLGEVLANEALIVASNSTAAELAAAQAVKDANDLVMAAFAAQAASELALAQAQTAAALAAAQAQAAASAKLVADAEKAMQKGIKDAQDALLKSPKKSSFLDQLVEYIYKTIYKN